MKPQLLTLLRSFATPRGRIGPWAFWWRQLLLTALLYPATYYLVTTLSWMDWGKADAFILIPACLTQGAPTSFMAVFMAAAEAPNEVRLDDNFCCWPEPGISLTPELLLGMLLVYPLAWCSFALLLRRLRDLPAGLWALPFCLSMFWGMGIEASGLAQGGLFVSLCLLLGMVAFVITSMPGKDAPTGAEDGPLPPPEPTGRPHFLLYTIIGLLTLAALFACGILTMADNLSDDGQMGRVLLWSLILFLPNYLLGIAGGRRAMEKAACPRVLATAVLLIPIVFNIWLGQPWGMLPLLAGFAAVLFSRSRFADKLPTPGHPNTDTVT